MRTLTTAETRILDAPEGFEVKLRVQVADSTGTFHALESQSGWDFVTSVEINESIDEPVASATVSLKREVMQLSLAPLMEASKLNRLTGTYQPLLMPGAQIIISTATLPRDAYVDSTHVWRPVFQGYIDRVRWASDPIILECRDLGALQQDTFIETEAYYSDADGEPLEDIMQAIIDANDTYWASGITLNVPSSPGTNFVKFKQEKMSLMEALRGLAQQIGWDVRYRYDSGWKLTLYEPPRDKVSIDYTWQPTRYYDVTNLDYSRHDIRNAIAVTYSDPADLDVTGKPKRKTRVRTDSTSITTHGRRYMEVAEDANSNIDSQSEADALGDAVLSDLKDPIAEQSIETPYFWPIQLHDLYRFKANGVHYDTDKDWAVVAYRHTLSPDSCRTSIDVRGRVIGARRDWLAMEARAGNALPNDVVGPEAPTSVTVTRVSGGVSIEYQQPTNPAAPKWNTTELHLSKTSGFTPSSSTLAEEGRANSFVRTDLEPGVTYYGVVIARDALGNRSSASSEFSFQAGYTTPTMMVPAVTYQALPFNPDFEAHSNTSAPPDTWTMAVGTWGTDATVITGSTAYSGNTALRLINTSTATEIHSQLFIAKPGDRFYIDAVLSAYVTGGGSNFVNVDIVFYSDAGSTEVGRTECFFVQDSSTLLWAPRFFDDAVAPAGSKYGRVEIYKDSSTYNVAIDGVRLLQKEPLRPWATVPDGSMSNSWLNFDATHAVGYRKDPNNMVYTKGLLKSGTINTTAFTLSAGFRPPRELFLATTSNGAFAHVVIEPDGDVRPAVGSNASFSLDGLCWLAE